MRNITNGMRIAATQFVMDVMNAIYAYSSGDTKSDKTVFDRVSSYLPKFKLKIDFHPPLSTNEIEHSIRYFTFLNRKDKGKKRIYVAQERFKNDMYIFYMQKERIKRICGSEPHRKWIVDLLGNKWVITAGLHHFKDLYQLMNHTIAIERGVSRKNYPPTGSRDWMCADAISRKANRYRSMFVPYHVISVDLSEFNFGAECERLIN